MDSLLGQAVPVKPMLSGSGCDAENLPIFEQSAASWMPQGSKTEKCSVQKIAEFVGANDKGIIYLDEIEKPFPPDLSKTIPWETVLHR
jgi:hypothetical protein